MSEVKFNFTGKNFMVVGASSGMGRQIALELAESGAHVLAVARNEERLQAVKDKYPNQIEYDILDVTTGTLEDWEKIVKNFVEHHGKLNGEIYTAGTTGVTPLKFYDENMARNIMETGFWGAVKSLQIATKKKFANPKSSYVFFSSVSSYTGEKGIAFYSATKAAIRIAMQSFCHDVARERHRINTISPGQVNTSMTINAATEGNESKRVIENHLLGIAEPSDVSGMVLFLLSDRASWITGEDFIVDGGYMRGAWR